MYIFPFVVNNPLKISKNVDFPEPDAPEIKILSLANKSKFIFSNIILSEL